MVEIIVPSNKGAEDREMRAELLRVISVRSGPPTKEEWLCCRRSSRPLSDPMMDFINRADALLKDGSKDTLAQPADMGELAGTNSGCG